MCTEILLQTIRHYHPKITRPELTLSSPLQKKPNNPKVKSPTKGSFVPIAQQKPTARGKQLGYIQAKQPQLAPARAEQGPSCRAVPASLTKSPANAPRGTQPALRGCKLCPGADSSPAPPCQGAFYRRHPCACIPRCPGLTASFIAANYWQESCRRAGGCEHLPDPNDVRFCAAAAP